MGYVTSTRGKNKLIIDDYVYINQMDLARGVTYYCIYKCILLYTIIYIIINVYNNIHYY